MGQVAFWAVFVAGQHARSEPVALRILPTDVTCPAPAEVAAALTRITPGVHVVNSAPALEARLAVHDSDYAVEVAGSRRSFVDAAHNCDERAKAVAIFLALKLEPPSLHFDEPAAPAAVPATRVTPRRIVPSVALEAGGVFGLAPYQPTPVLGGAVLRGAIGVGRFAATLGGQALSPIVISIGNESARVTRIPLDLGARVSFHLGRSELGLDLGLAATVLRVEGQSKASAPELRLELGIRAAAWYRVWLHRRVAPFFAIDTDIVPRPYQLRLHATGQSGALPQIWLAASAGVTIKIH